MEKLNAFLSGLEGNSDKYDLENVKTAEKNILDGKRILFLGSSVTLGFGSLNVSFADYIAKRNGLSFVKEAVNGTTLVNNGETSYLERLKKHSDEKFDLVVCQLSTNDARLNYDIKEIEKAILNIVDFVRQTLNSKIVFYTNCRYENEVYLAMVDLINKLKIEKQFDVIDLYNDDKFNDISPSQRKLYMFDEVHPTRAGYLLWWTPVIESFFKEYFKSN